MIRLFLTVVLAGLTPFAFSGPAHVAGQNRSARILIDAVAFDGNGMPVSNLKQDEVEVWIGHFRVPIESFTPVTPATDRSAGRLTVLVLDDLTLPLPLTSRAKDVARRFVNRMAPGDRLAIVTLDGSAMEATDDRTRLLRAIDAYSVRLGGNVPIDRIGGHVLGTLGALSRQMIEAGEQRKTIVGIGSGWLFDRPIPPPTTGFEPRKEWIAAMQAMALANVTLYAIDPAGIVTTRVDTGGNGLARQTGGVAFVATNNLDGAVDQIMRESASYYLLGVGDPPVGHGADLRELDVKVLRRQVSIRARRLITGGS